MMARRMMRKHHVRCRAGEKVVRNGGVDSSIDNMLKIVRC